MKYINFDILKNKKIISLIIVFITIVLVFNCSHRFIYPLKYREIVTKNSIKYGVDPFLVYAIIKAESGFDEKAISRKNARGLMQISEKTGKWASEELNLENYSNESLFLSNVNIEIGCWYIKTLMNQFENRQELVIAAYNGGSANVSKWLKDKNFSNTGNSLEIIPFEETDTFLKKVKNFYFNYKTLYENEI